MGIGDTTGRRKLKAEEIAGLVRAVPKELLEKALDRSIAISTGAAAAALKAIPRPADAAKIAIGSLPDEALAAIGAVLLELACQQALQEDPDDAAPPAPDAEDPGAATAEAAPPPLEPVVDFDKTGAFTGKVWSPDTREGSFRTFFESSANLGRADFMARYRSPFLMSPVSFEPSTWGGAVVLPLSKKDEEDDSNQITLGREETNDVVAKHPSVSRRHAVFSLVEGRWFLTDLGGSNGTRVEGKRVEANKPIKLPRDVVQIDFGDARLTFNTPEDLFHFIEQIKKLQPKAGAKASPAPAPRPPQARAPQIPGWELPKVKDTQRVKIPPAAKAKPAAKTAVMKSMPAENPSLGELLRNPVVRKRIGVTVGAILLVIVVIWKCGPTIGYLIFGDSWVVGK